MDNQPTNEEIPETFEPSLINHHKLSNLDTAILTLKRQNPQLTAYQVGQALLKHKVSKNRLTVYNRLKANDYLQAEFKALENHYREQLLREEYPLARKSLRKVLKNKDKDIPAAVEMQAVKLVYDKVHADRQDKIPESPVIIENIERLQVLVQSDVSQVDK